MLLNILRCVLSEIQELRTLFLNELNAQFIHDKCHLYGWSDDYLFTIDGTVAGYGCVWGIDRRQDRDTIFEFYILPQFRRQETTIIREFVQATGVTTLECQTNDPNTSRLFFETASDISVQSILFTDFEVTDWPLMGLQVIDQSPPDEYSRERRIELCRNDEVIATGGLMLNYNLPFADVYMEVHQAHQGQGYGALVVQEIKRVAYEMDRIPAARCRVTNAISKATLLRAGFRACGYLLTGKIPSAAEG